MADAAPETMTDPAPAGAPAPAGSPEAAAPATAPAAEEPALAGLDIFLPVPPPDAQAQEEFLDEAAQLALAGHPITVYLQDEDAWAFEECEPVRGLLEAAGPSALPVTLLGLDIVVTAVYPTIEQMKRFAAMGGQKRERKSAAASACGPGGTAAAAPRTAGGFAAQLMGAPTAGGFAGALGGTVAPLRAADAPEIGARRNLLGGDIGDGLPSAGESAVRAADRPVDSSAGPADEDGGIEVEVSGGCCGGGCCGGS